MFRKVLLTVGLLLAANVVVFAQGTLRGTIKNASTKEPEPFVNVVVLQNGEQKGGAQTDFDGNYTIKPLAPGNYDVKVSSVGFAPVLLKNVPVKASGFSYAEDIMLEPSSKTLDEVKIVEHKIPLVDKGNPESGQRVSKEDIARMSGNDVSSIVAVTTAGVGYSDGGTGTARGEDNMVTYVGNARKNTSVSVPKEAIEEIQVILGGTPARYGEAIGGTQIITLRPPSNLYHGSINYQTYLDYRLNNRLSLYLSGPIVTVQQKAEDGTEGTKRTLLGFRLSGMGQYVHTNMYRPNERLYQIVNDDKRVEMEQNPLVYDPLTGAINYAGEYLTKDDFTTVKRRKSADYYMGYVEGSLDLAFTDNAILRLSGEFSYIKSNSPVNMYFNDGATSVTDQGRYSINADFTHRFPDAGDNVSQGDATMPATKSGLTMKNMMYNLTAQFERVWTEIYNPDFGSDLFKYGHIGTFKTEKIPTYAYQRMVINGVEQMALVQQAWQDNMTYVGPSEYNPILANYNNQLYYSDEFAGIASMLTNEAMLVNFRGLRNGDSPNNIYSLLNNVGLSSIHNPNDGQYSYYKGMSDYIFVQARAGVDIGKHAIELGFQYDQRTSHSYSLDARQLWTIMRQSANSHIMQMDLSNPIIDDSGEYPVVSYDRLVGEGQTHFDAAFREKYGLSATDWIDVDSYDPSAFSMDMLSADELFNSGNSIVSYSGYDYMGNLTYGKSSLQDFFDDKTNRPIGAFSPIYMAGYIQDQFEFNNDLIFNVGVRVDRFDANQMVMKDPYLLYDSYTVGELRNGNGSIAYQGEIPTAVGDDWVPYVDAVSDNPTIVGYRHGSTWYNADGVEVSDPYAVKGSSGKPTPYRKDASTSPKLSADAFEDYEPQLVVMPRIAFSFPVSDKSQFKASYDIIARRPSSYWQADYDSYLFMTQISAISNPNLKPEKITNYELGFEQALNQNSAIKISAYYKETRDLIQLVQYVGADPNPNYYSFDNIDFKTTKGFSLAYDLRQTKNIRLSANYTLQYAEGTGISQTTMQQLIKEGFSSLKVLSPIADDRRHEFKLNLDFRYAGGKKYNGPTWTRKVKDENGEERAKTVNLLENFGVNINAVAQSGRPYTKALSNTQKTIVGSYRGARLPWGFYIDAVVDKMWTIKVGSKGRDTYLRAAIAVTNLFDIRNILGVYPVTGNPDDNGYLTDPGTQSIINAYLNPDSFRDMYSIMLMNSWNYSIPRLIRFELTYQF